MIHAIQNDDFEFVKLLVEHEADVNLHNGTPAVIAAAGCQNCQTKTVRYLLENNAKIDAEDHKGKTLLM